MIGGPHVSRGVLHRRSQCYTTIYEPILSGFVSLASMFDARSVLHISTNHRMRHVEPFYGCLHIHTHMCMHLVVFVRFAHERLTQIKLIVQD